MLKKLFFVGIATLLLLSGFVVIQLQNWKTKQDYAVKVFRNDQIQYPIYFKGLKANILFDKKQPEKSTITATIDAKSIDTGIEEMTAHAKEPEILHTEKFPVITLQSTSIKKNVGTYEFGGSLTLEGISGSYEFTGNLTLKGITKQVKFPFIFEKNVFRGKFSIIATDYNILNKNAVPSGEIKIELTVPVAE